MVREMVRYIENKDGSLREQKLPDLVKYVNDGGVFVLEEVVVDKGRITLVKGKLPYDLATVKDWTEEEVRALPDFNYYISNVDGGYIGSSNDYQYLVVEKGLILIQKADSSHNTCSIGYQPEENKWYGWSHRAIYGFTIGDVVKEDDLTSQTGFVKEYEIQHPEECRNLPVGFEAKNLNDAKRMAIAFAYSVS